MKNKNYVKINLIYFIAIFLVALVFCLGYFGILKNDILTSFLIQVVVMFGIPLLMYSLLMKKNLKETFSDFGFHKISTNVVLISILLGFVLYFINSFVANAFYSFISLLGYESLGTSTTTFNYSTLLKELVLSCVLPGFCEEFLHRGLMLHANKKHSNPRFCLIISSILFGLTHLNIRQFFYAAILGLLMGYVTLAANSIYPSIIIHFMNNFLSNYFFYGTHLNWPLAKFINFVSNIFMSNPFIYITASSAFTIGLLFLYHHLTKIILKERAKSDIQNIMKELKMDKLTLIQAQLKLNEVNKILKNKEQFSKQNTKHTLLSNIFLISSLTLGGLITISSFIWGVI